MYSTIIQTLESALTQLGIHAGEAKLAEGQYNLNKDEHTEVLLDVWQEQERVFMQILSPVTKINDNKRTEVFKMLLEENHGLVEASFALINDDIVVKQTTECPADLSEARIIASLSRIAFYSENYRTKWLELSQAV